MLGHADSQHMQPDRCCLILIQPDKCTYLVKLPNASNALLTGSSLVLDLAFASNTQTYGSRQ